MTRLKKELKKRGIIFDNYDETGSNPYESSSSLAFVSNGFVVTVYGSNMIDPFFTIHDRNLNPIADQDVYPCFGIFQNNRWSSYVY